MLALALQAEAAAGGSKGQAAIDWTMPSDAPASARTCLCLRSASSTYCPRQLVACELILLGPE